jgi:hypothetical protein
VTVKQKERNRRRHAARRGILKALELEAKNRRDRERVAARTEATTEATTSTTPRPAGRS